MEGCLRNYCLEVGGDYAAFHRPELKVERVSYDVITPSAARAIFTAIFWKPAILWHVRRIEVLNPIQFTSVRRNEVAALASPGKEVYIEDFRQQRAALCLADVRYRLTAQMEYLPPEKRTLPQKDDDSEPETPAKYFAMFERRAAKGQHFHAPYLGCREFAAKVRYLPAETLAAETAANPALGPEHDRDLGIMLYDLDFTDPANPAAMFYRAKMVGGVIEVPPENSPEVLR